MPDLYVDSARGTDTVGLGTTAADPLRTLTFAVEEAARRFATSRTIIHLAEGTYSRASGELFPIEMAQNISVVGAGVGRTVILFERTVLDMYEIALGGGEELSAFTLRGVPLSPDGCDLSTGIRLTTGSSFVHDLTIEIAAGSPDAEHAFGRGLHALNTARIENVHVSRCRIGVAYGGGNARIARCRLIANQQGISAEGTGVIQNCTFDGNHEGVRVWSGAETAVETSRFDRCVWAVFVETGVSSGLFPVIRGNAVNVEAYGIACFGAALVENNDIATDQGGFGIVADSAFPARRTTDLVGSSPTFRNNRIERVGPFDSSRYRGPLAQFGNAASPVLEGNRFWAADGYAYDLIWIFHDANPDLGGGLAGSAGNNRFEGGRLVFVQDELSPRKEIFARNNVWQTVPPRAGSDMYRAGDYYVDPRERRDTVVVHTDGARPL